MLHPCYKAGFLSFSCNPIQLKGTPTSLLGAWLTVWTWIVQTNERMHVMSPIKLSFERTVVPNCQLFQLGQDTKLGAHPLPSEAAAFRTDRVWPSKHLQKPDLFPPLVPSRRLRPHGQAARPFPPALLCFLYSCFLLDKQPGQISVDN